MVSDSTTGSASTTGLDASGNSPALDIGRGVGSMISGSATGSATLIGLDTSAASLALGMGPGIGAMISAAATGSAFSTGFDTSGAFEVESTDEGALRFAGSGRLGDSTSTSFCMGATVTTSSCAVDVKGSSEGMDGVTSSVAGTTGDTVTAGREAGSTFGGASKFVLSATLDST